MRNPAPQLTIIEDAPDGLHLKMLYHREVEVLCFVKHWIPDVKIVNNPHLENLLLDQIRQYMEGADLA